VVRGADDQVVLVGGGDMLLAAGAGNPDAVVGHAGLADLARQAARALALAGTTHVRVRLDDTLFTGPRLSPTWAPSDIAAGYVAAVAPIGVDVGKIKPGEYPPRYPDPALQAANQFAVALVAAGVKVDGPPTRGTAPDGAAELGVVQSAPLGDVVHYFLSTSDNTITEVVARLVAVDAKLPGSFEGATQAVLAHVRTLGVDTSGAHLSDASGLGAGSALPPALLLHLLRLSTDPAHPALRGVATGMPIGGLSGTLSDRFTRSSARGMVRAKTGSLPSVTALAGSVHDADGRVLLFVVLADATPHGQTLPRSVIDAFVGTLAACGCR
jgi:D-alanyl-D-alanine carboxypeptidase/D-alanyl-D-alanine-endopeptidase (penicillin-binding protein 4)